MSVICSKCRAENDDSGQFCSQCGNRLDVKIDSTLSFSLGSEAGDELKVDIDQLYSESPLLIVVKGIGVGHTFLLSSKVKELLIGRDPENDIFLDDVTVSRKHATIASVPSGHELTDTGSLNGTYVNRDRVESKLLADGDELQIGKFKMIYINQHRVMRSGQDD